VNDLLTIALPGSDTREDARRRRTCPVDGYDLAGLPMEHRCPECGFGFDGQTRVWRVDRPWRLVVLPVTLLVILLTGVSANALGMTASFQGSKGSMIRLIVAGAVTALWGWYACLAWIMARSGPFLATAPSGIVARLSDQVPRMIPWSRVAKVNTRWNGAHSWCWVELRDPDERMELGVLVRSRRDSVCFRQAVRMRMGGIRAGGER